MNKPLRMVTPMDPVEATNREKITMRKNRIAKITKTPVVMTGVFVISGIKTLELAQLRGDRRARFGQ